MLAAAAGGVRRFLERRGRIAPPLKAMVPVSMRAQRAHSELGNEISFVFIDLPCDEPDPQRRFETIRARIGCELEEAYPVVPLADRHALSIGMTTIKNEACFGVYADREALPDADLLADGIDTSIDELLRIADERSGRRVIAGV